MNKKLAVLALAAGVAVMVSACNGNAGGSSGITPSAPNARGGSHVGRIQKAISANMHAGGATFPAYGYNLGDQPVGTPGPGQPTPGPGSILASAGTAGVSFYCLTGSGFGRKEFEANNGTATMPCAALGASPSGFGGAQDPLDFVGSDVAMASTECCASGTTYYNGRVITSPSWGQPFELPTIGGPIVFPYNHSSFKIGAKANIKLSTWTYCAIANGTISDWNDAAITADNGKSVTGGVSHTLDFYFRSDSSGTSYLTTNKLNTSCNVAWKGKYNSPPYQGAGRSAAWTFGVNSQWPGPGSPADPNPRFFGESGNPGVLAGIKADAFGTGYAEGAWAAAAAVAQASLLDTGGTTFVSPTNKKAVAGALAGATTITFGGGSDGSPLGSSTPWCQLYIDPSQFTTPPAGTYPFVGLSYWLFYGNNNGIHVAEKKKLVSYIASAAANKLLVPLEYSPLANSVHTAIITALNGSGSHTACLK